MEGLYTLVECHDQGFNLLLEQFRRLSIGQQATTETSRMLSNPATSGAFPQLRKNPAYLLQSATLGILEPALAFLSQFSLIFELQPSPFPSDRS